MSGRQIRTCDLLNPFNASLIVDFQRKYLRSTSYVSPQITRIDLFWQVSSDFCCNLLATLRRAQRAPASCRGRAVHPLDSSAAVEHAAALASMRAPAPARRRGSLSAPERCKQVAAESLLTLPNSHSCNLWRDEDVGTVSMSAENRR